MSNRINVKLEECLRNVCVMSERDKFEASRMKRFDCVYIYQGQIGLADLRTRAVINQSFARFSIDSKRRCLPLVLISFGGQRCGGLK